MGALSSRPGSAQGGFTSTAGLRVAQAAGELAGAAVAAKLEASAWAQAHPQHTRARFFVILYRHHSGKTKLFIEQIVRPLLDAAGIRYLIVPSKFRGSAASLFHTHDFSRTDGILVLGSDGFLNEVVTGLLERFDALPCPIGVVPCGHCADANALASHLDDTVEPLSPERSAFRAVMRAIRGDTHAIDILRVSSATGRSYAVTHVGWGLPGAIAVHMDRLRWVPHHTLSDAATLVTRARHWPKSRCVLSYPVDAAEAGPITATAPPDDAGPHAAPSPAGSASVAWEERNVAVHGLMATTLPTLGPRHLVSQDVADDDGHVVLVLVPETLPRAELVRIALEMRKGKYLADNKNVVALRVREFRLTPHEGLAEVPYIVDGEPMASGAVHVRVLPRILPIFASPTHRDHDDPWPPAEASDSTVGAVAAAAAASVVVGGAGGVGGPVGDAGAAHTSTESVPSANHAASPPPVVAGNSPPPVPGPPYPAISRLPAPASAPALVPARAPSIARSPASAVADNDVAPPTATALSPPLSASVFSPFPSPVGPRAGRCSFQLLPRAACPTTAVTRAEVEEFLQKASYLRRRTISRRFSVDELKEEENAKQDAHKQALAHPRASDPVEGLEAFDETAELDALATDDARRMRIVSVADQRQHAVRVVAERVPSASAPKHLTLIYNPISGQGRALRVLEQMVLPVLEAANVPHTLVATQHRGHATEYVRDLDIGSTSGVVVCGGDGMVSEVVTGLMLNRDARAADMPVGLVAVGTANAMATHVDGGRAKSKIELIANAAVAMVKGHTTRVDVIELVLRDGVRHALSCIGWALAGEVTSQADRLRSLPLPGQKNARYEIAGLVTLAAHWPVTTEARLGYFASEPGPDGKPVETWKEENVSCVNFIATNLPVLGNGNPISRDVSPDDGNVAICLLDNIGRADTVRTALYMKRGNYLADHPLVRTIITREFTLLPLEGSRGANIPYNVDGDPVAAQPLRVRVLHRRLRLFCLAPPGETASTSSAATNPDGSPRASHCDRTPHPASTSGSTSAVKAAAIAAVTRCASEPAPAAPADASTHAHAHSHSLGSTNTVASIATVFVGARVASSLSVTTLTASPAGSKARESSV